MKPFFSNKVLRSLKIISRSENLISSFLLFRSSKKLLVSILHSLYFLFEFISLTILNLIKPFSSIKYLPSPVSLNEVIFPKQPILYSSGF